MTQSVTSAAASTLQAMHARATSAADSSPAGQVGDEDFGSCEAL